MLGSGDEVGLDVGVEADEELAEAGDADDEVAVGVGVFPGGAEMLPAMRSCGRRYSGMVRRCSRKARALATGQGAPSFSRKTRV